MNGTSGFQEVRSSTSRSPISYRFLHEQRHQFGTGSLAAVLAEQYMYRPMPLRRGR